MIELFCVDNTKKCTFSKHLYMFKYNYDVSDRYNRPSFSIHQIRRLLGTTFFS